MNTSKDNLIDRLENSHIKKHLEEPYSDVALADSDRDWIDLGKFDISNLPHEGVMPGKHIKWEGLGSNDFKYEHPITANMHRTVETAAKLIIPESHHDETKIYFNHQSSQLFPGQHFTLDDPHIDGAFPNGGNKSQLRILAIAMNSVSTGLLKGSLAKDDFINNGVISNRLKPEAIDKLQLAEVPLDTLILLSPSTVHFAQLAKEEIPERHFLRWQIHY